jgi:iron complex outermembrane receptor protein
MLAVTLGVLAPQVGAAEPGSSGSSDTSGSSVEVLVIRSQRHARGAQDASLSVTVLGAEQLEQRGIQDALDLARFVPNVNIQTSANGNGFFVNSRGISQDDAGLISRDPATAVYIDGVYWGRTQGNLINVLDLERVEVLRGPQGVLNGRNASAGAIHFVTRKPSGGTGTRLSLRSGTKLRGDLGLWQEFPVFGYGRPDAPHPWGRLSGSLALSTNHRDPDYRNDFGPDTGEERRLSGRVALHHEFGRFVADWSADYSHAREQGPEMQLTHVFGETATAVSLFPFENSDRAARIDLDADAGSVFLLEGGGTAPAPGLADDETDVFGTSLTIGVELENTLLGSARLRSITGYRSVEDRVVNDRDGSPIPVFTNVNQGDVAQVTQEFDLVGTRSLGGGEIDYVLGAFFLHDEGSQRSLAFAFGADGSQQTSRIHDKAQAVFGHASYTPGFLGGRLDLELGLRQTWERKRIDVERLDSGGASGVRARNDFRELTPMGGVGLRLHESARIWATISKGYTAGGFNARSTANDPYREETVLAYEVGLKLRSSQGRLRLDLAGFYQKYEDLQRTVFDFVGGRPSSVVRNAGRATIEIGRASCRERVLRDV